MSVFVMLSNFDECNRRSRVILTIKRTKLLCVIFRDLYNCLFMSFFVKQKDFRKLFALIPNVLHLLKLAYKNCVVELKQTECICHNCYFYFQIYCPFLHFLNFNYDLNIMYFIYNNSIYIY